MTNDDHRPARIVFDVMVDGRLERIILEEHRIIQASTAAWSILKEAYRRFDLDQHHDPGWHVAADLISRYGGQIVEYTPERLPPDAMH
jgi:hypothetical protein